MLMQIHRNGYYAVMVDLRDNGAHLVPNTKIALKQHHVELGSVDYSLTVFQLFFANVVDGSSPGLSLFAFQLAGTLFAVLTLICTESLKAASDGWEFILIA